jgi:septum site-determining protein MinD
VPPTPLPRAATVAVAGGKGGCGKTTATLGLAAALVERGRHPLAVDADVAVPDLHIRAGVDREPGLPAVRAGAHPAAVAQESPTCPGVAVLSAGASASGAEPALAAVAALDRPAVVDSPAGAGPDAAAPLRVADAAVVVSTATRVGRADAAKTVRMARSLAAEPRARLERAVPGGEPGGCPAGLQDLPAVELPAVRRRPLRSSAVRAACRRLATVLYDR